MDYIIINDCLFQQKSRSFFRNANSIIFRVICIASNKFVHPASNSQTNNHSEIKFARALLAHFVQNNIFFVHLLSTTIFSSIKLSPKRGKMKSNTVCLINVKQICHSIYGIFLRSSSKMQFYHFSVCNNTTLHVLCIIFIIRDCTTVRVPTTFTILTGITFSETSTCHSTHNFAWKIITFGLRKHKIKLR